MSIKQNAYSDGLPDFRSLGVTARILVAVNLVAIAAACYAESGWTRGFERFVHDAAFIEPALLASIVALYAISPLLVPMRYLTACFLVLVVVLGIVAGVAHVVQSIGASRRAECAKECDCDSDHAYPDEYRCNLSKRKITKPEP